jgi:hypothetical protein
MSAVAKRAASMMLATSAGDEQFFARHLSFVPISENLTMAILVIAVLMIALVATVLALCREVRLRKALQRLLQLVLNRWRSHASKPKAADRDPLGRRNNPDEWL